MTHHASPDFWTHHRALPEDVKALADKFYSLLNADPRHPSLHFKKVGKFCSVRVGLFYRTLGTEVDEGIVWF